MRKWITSVLTDPILNSSFVIFFLSSVVIALITFSYAQWTNYRDNSQTIHRIDIEVSLRLHTMDRISCAHPDNENLGTLLLLRDIFYGSISDPYIPRPSYTEFEDKSLSALLWQSYALDSQSKSVRQDIGRAWGIESLISQAVLRTLKALQSSNKLQYCKTFDPATLILEKNCNIPGSMGQTDIYVRVHQLSEETPWSGDQIKRDSGGCIVSIEAAEKPTSSWWESLTNFIGAPFKK